MASDFTNKPAIYAAKEQLKSLGVDVIGVAYGSNVDTSTIRRISSSPNQENFKVASTITDLLSRLPRSVVASACKSKLNLCKWHRKNSENSPYSQFDDTRCRNPVSTIGESVRSLTSCCNLLIITFAGCSITLFCFHQPGFFAA